MVTGFLAMLQVSPVAASEPSSTNHFVAGLKTVANNSKIIGWNVLSGIGTGIVHVTNALVPTSYLFKESMENPKTALCAAAITTYLGYTIKSSVQLAAAYTEAHTFVHADRFYVKADQGEEKSHIRIGYRLQDCYQDLLNEVKKIVLAKPNSNKHEKKDDAELRYKNVINDQINSESAQLIKEKRKIEQYLKHSSLMPQLLYEAPILVEQVVQNLKSAGKLADFKSYGELSENEIRLIEKEVQRLNKFLVNPHAEIIYPTDESCDEDSFDVPQTRIADIKGGIAKGARYLASIMVRTPKAIVTGLRVMPHALNKWLVNMIYTKEQQAQWDYWLLCKQQAALERLQNNLCLAQ
jgi:hypothetical protein